MSHPPRTLRPAGFRRRLYDAGIPVIFGRLRDRPGRRHGRKLAAIPGLQSH
jgi:hypothetical protein